MSVLWFPFWALIAVSMAYWQADFFAAQKSFILPLLALIMLTMGLGLKWQDFVQVWRMKKLATLGGALQFSLMPLAAFLIAKGLNLSTELTIGMVLVGATAGGTASNVMTFLAGGHLALSIAMTLLSTLAAVVLMPFLVWLYIGSDIEVPIWGMFAALIKLTLLPVLCGMLLRHFFEPHISPLMKQANRMALIGILWIIMIIVALNQSQLAALSWVLLLAVVLHNGTGLFFGYWLARGMGYDSRIARTLAIEVGMQNSGLSVALAIKFFSPLTALPGALFSIWHNLSGAVFASYWHFKEKSEGSKVVKN